MPLGAPVWKKARRYLRAIVLVLGVAAFVVSLIVTDSFQPPADQFSAGLFIAAVHAYQRYVSPSLAGLVHCRFRPTCSHYSIEAVRRYGIARGLVLTIRRLRRCTNLVPDGAYDPVP